MGTENFLSLLAIFNLWSEIPRLLTS